MTLREISIYFAVVSLQGNLLKFYSMFYCWGICPENISNVLRSGYPHLGFCKGLYTHVILQWHFHPENVLSP